MTHLTAAASKRYSSLFADVVEGISMSWRQLFPENFSDNRWVKLVIPTNKMVKWSNEWKVQIINYSLIKINSQRQATIVPKLTFRSRRSADLDWSGFQAESIIYLGSWDIVPEFWAFESDHRRLQAACWMLRRTAASFHVSVLSTQLHGLQM